MSSQEKVIIAAISLVQAGRPERLIARVGEYERQLNELNSLPMPKSKAAKINRRERLQQLDENRHIFLAVEYNHAHKLPLRTPQRRKLFRIK